MINSPCVNCPKRNQPKDKCAKTCAILNAIQNHQLSIKETKIASAVDYADEGRFSISASSPNFLTGNYI